MASPATFEHEEIISLVQTTMRYFVEARQLGTVVSSNVGFRLSEHNVFQPDISFVRTERLHLVEDIVFGGAPDIAVEVISPSSRRYDTVEKKINYGRYGVGEYWLIDPIERTAAFYRRIDSQLEVIPSEPGVVRSKILDGYWLQLNWLFPVTGETRPSVLEMSRSHRIIK